MVFSPQRCLVVGPSWVGDMVMAHSLFMALKQRFPGLQIDVLAPAWSQPLLAAMPEINQALEMPLQHGELGIGKRYRLGKTLRDKGYDWAIVLPGSLKAALVPFWAHIPVRTGYRGEWRYGWLNDIRPLDKSVLRMTVQRFVALGLPADAALPPNINPPRLQITATQTTAVQQKFLDFPASSGTLLALCPGAEYGSAKRWLPAYFAEVARYQIANGGNVILLGSSKDAAITATIAAAVNAPHCLDLGGKTSLAEAMALLALADKAVSNDSGLMHIAAAVGTPLIALYGSSDPAYTPPLSDAAHILYLGLECSPCFKRACPLGHLDCLHKISPQDVISLL